MLDRNDIIRQQPLLSVGIMTAREISFELVSDGGGVRRAVWSDGRIAFEGRQYDELTFPARSGGGLFAEPSFVLHDVTIGVSVHWERKVTQTFAGTLKIIVNGDSLTAVNIVGVEDYLLSVISSEMKSTASLEFLKAHAVISRSWVMSRILGRPSKGSRRSTCMVSDKEIIRWFDQEDHSLFDVCADDHCQRYQGCTMAVGETVRTAVEQTWGQVLEYEGRICDARFSKCCGGVSETFGTCWEDASHPYLQALPDTPDHSAEEKPFCDTSDEAILSQVLNDYDLETRDFFRWTVEYDRKSLSELIRARSGIDFGTIRDLVPVERGGSGRISRLLIKGDAAELVVGKELMVRRWLSPSHLKSSAFDVSWSGDNLVLQGKGWGHGAGLCQIGAAVMASRGYSYSQILEHYYPGSSLVVINDKTND
ncbi:MAG: SpoIID/LytB domain-containing protein [Bacteroidales bacterium]|nr:SpoIID/LytB domain-containing protein [Bacteroidales bacterium]